jgi:hypothetical protein
MQIALVDDHVRNQNGQLRGPLIGEAAETIIIDFLASPQVAPAPPPTPPPPGPISDQTRARRMAAYRFANHSRLLNPALPAGANNPSVLKPQMPLWMAELQIVGITQAQLTALMTRRHRQLRGTASNPPVDLRLDLQWQLTLSWDGPDSNSPAFSPPAVQRFPRPDQTYTYSQAFAGTQVVQLHFGQQGQFTDAAGQNITVSGQGEVPGAFVPVPTAITFPVAGRRLPQVVVSGQNRPWGRQATATQRETLLVEFQPAIVEGNNEVMRGGDGVIVLQTLSIDNQRIDGGLIGGDDNTSVPPLATDPDMHFPRFRVRGLNPGPHPTVEALINALVEEFFTANAANPRIALLTLNCWQATARLIFQHENGGDRQFAERSSRSRFTQSRSSPPPALAPLLLGYGLEDDMPLFGPPHGYGFGQLDLMGNPPRGANNNEVWSFLENIRSSVRVIMEEKAIVAFNLFTQGIGVPAATRPAAIAAFNALAATDPQRRRAMYQREIVRRYNGGREFQFEGGNWVIHTTVGQARHNYPNDVLGTTPRVVYPGPVALTAAQFGPGT